ncbi:MAG: hypothetical protein P1U56_06980 [Saprospiraceae bacterium]|nr:hypothetical protein [Saprospiraceae bacterium]
MFKVKLIESNTYYSQRVIYLILLFIQPLFAGLLVNYSIFPLWFFVLLLGSFMATVWASKNNQKKIAESTEKHYLELKSDSIVVKSRKGLIKEKYDIQDIDKLSLKKEYDLDNAESNWIQELKGNHLQNFLEFVNAAGNKRFNFVIESHYQLKQLQKIKNSWKNQDLIIEYI